MKKKKLTIFIGIYAVIACILLYITENILHPLYIIQASQKILLFLLIPLGIGFFLKTKLGKFGNISKESYKYGIGFGIFGALVIGGAYLLLLDFIEWNSIRESLEMRGVNSVTFIFIFVYIMFGNSLLEEYFFRGLVFQNLVDHSKIFAYIFNSILFALYHIVIFGTWFHGYILGLALIGLFLGSIFFSWLYEKTNGIWGARIFHICADFVILVIGYLQLFK